MEKKKNILSGYLVSNDANKRINEEYVFQEDAIIFDDFIKNFKKI